jgi:hypothetical protein
MDKLPSYLSDGAEEFHYMYVDCALLEAQIPVDLITLNPKNGMI